jgi:hypothetical protein
MCHRIEEGHQVRKRIVLTLIGIALAVAVLVPTAVAVVSRDASSTTTSLPRAVWKMKVKGVRTLELGDRNFAAYKALNRTTYTDTVTGEVYSGVSLKALVGLVDDRNPRTFNEGLAATAPGYIVRVIAIDTFSHDFTSADIATKNIIVADKVLAAGATAELALPFGTAKYKTSSNSASFSPAWPIKLVGADITSGSMKVGGIQRIEIRPAPVTTR